MKKSIVLLTDHYYNSKRRAGFHFLASAYKNLDFEVTFVTDLSLLALIFARERFKEDEFIANLISRKNFGGINSIFNLSLLRSASGNNTISNFLWNKFYKLNKNVAKEIRNASYIIFESACSIKFFSEVRSLNPSAKLIYRMSDDMELLGFSEKLIRHERSILHMFDLVSVPTKTMYDKFSCYTSNNLRLQFHGIDKLAFDREVISPYTHAYNHTFVGTSHLDYGFIDIASSLFKNHLFHIIGPLDECVKKNNIIYYGEMRFKDTIPYIKFASSGLQIRSSGTKNNDDSSENHDIVSTLSDSLKVLQYTYCRLPIIAPSIISAKHRMNFIHYKYDNKESIEKCINDSLLFDKNSFNTTIHSWNELASEIILGIS